MKLLLPDKELLHKTGAVDYFYWNYKFPIKYIQLYRFKRIVKLLGKTHYKNLLEAGTGSGVFIPQLAKHCSNLYACDIHTNFSHIPALCAHYGIKNFDVSTQSIESTSYADNLFDAVVAVSVLEFVPDVEKALLEIKRILKNDGVFITICPMESRLLDFVLSLYTTKKPEEEFGNKRKSVSKMLEQHFEIEKKGYLLPIIGKLFPVYTHYKLKKP